MSLPNTFYSRYLYSVKNSKNLIKHIFFWVFYYFLSMFIQYDKLFDSIFPLIQFVISVIFFYFFTTIYFRKKNRFIYLIPSIISFYLIIVWCLFDFKINIALEKLPKFCFLAFDSFIRYIGLTIAYIVSLSLKFQQEDYLLETREIIQIEKDYLLNQSHQHFIYNSLNMIFAKSKKYENDLSKKILNLSDKLRKSLIYSNDNSTN